MKKSDFEIPDGKLGVYLKSCDTIKKNGSCKPGTPYCKNCPFDCTKFCLLRDGEVAKSAKQFIKLFKEDRMTFQEAVKEMICGKRVCCAEWTNPSCYYHLVDEMIMDQHNDVDFPLSCWIDKYWKIWEDPKKKVDITITVNGKPVDPKDISEETWNNLR